MSELNAVSTNLNETKSAELLPPTVTPQLVREIAEKVYKLWLKDLQIERDRLGRQGNSRFYYDRGR